eukprot:COSAG01_NODE_10849_length_2068_cov_2.814119_3_plen_49_part_00
MTRGWARYPGSARWSIRPECVLVPATSCSHLVFRGLVLVLIPKGKTQN